MEKFRAELGSNLYNPSSQNGKSMTYYITAMQTYKNVEIHLNRQARKEYHEEEKQTKSVERTDISINLAFIGEC